MTKEHKWFKKVEEHKHDSKCFAEHHENYW